MKYGEDALDGTSSGQDNTFRNTYTSTHLSYTNFPANQAQKKSFFQPQFDIYSVQAPLAAHIQSSNMHRNFHAPGQSRTAAPPHSYGNSGYGNSGQGSAYSSAGQHPSSDPFDGHGMGYMTQPATTYGHGLMTPADSQNYQHANVQGHSQDYGQTTPVHSLGDPFVMKTPVRTPVRMPSSSTQQKPNRYMGTQTPVADPSPYSYGGKHPHALPDEEPETPMADCATNDRDSDSDYELTPVKAKKKVIKARSKAQTSSKTMSRKAKGPKEPSGPGKKNGSSTTATSKKRAAPSSAPNAKRQKSGNPVPGVEKFSIDIATATAPAPANIEIDEDSNWEYEPDDDGSAPVKGTRTTPRKHRAARGKLMRWNERDRILMLLSLVTACGRDILLPFAAAAKLMQDALGIKCSQVAFQQALIKIRDKLRAEIMEELGFKAKEELPAAYQNLFVMSMTWPPKYGRGDKGDDEENEDGGKDDEKKAEAEKQRIVKVKTVYVDKIVEVEKVVEKPRPQYVDAEIQVCVKVPKKPRQKKSQVKKRQQESKVEQLATFPKAEPVSPEWTKALPALPIYHTSGSQTNNSETADPFSVLNSPFTPKPRIVPPETGHIVRNAPLQGHNQIRSSKPLMPSMPWMPSMPSMSSMFPKNQVRIPGQHVGDPDLWRMSQQQMPPPQMQPFSMSQPQAHRHHHRRPAYQDPAPAPGILNLGTDVGEHGGFTMPEVVEEGVVGMGEGEMGKCNGVDNSAGELLDYFEFDNGGYGI